MNGLRLTALGVTLLWGVLPGCGDLTSGGVGDMEVLVSADSVPIGDALGVGTVPNLGELGTQAPPDAPQIRGTLTVRLQVFLLRRPGRWIEITDGVQEVTLALEDPEPVTVARRDIPAGPYHAVRTLFRRVEANVEGGLEVDGEPVIGRIPVDLGLQDRLQIERGLDLQVGDGKLVELVVDLHARRWLRRLDTDRRLVDPEHFEDELKLRHKQ